MHTGKSPEKCGMCKNGYVESDRLKEHMLKMHTCSNVTCTVLDIDKLIIGCHTLCYI